MYSDTAIRVEGLGKKYVIGHDEADRYATLRDKLARGTKALWRKTLDMSRGRAIVQGDTTEEIWALKDVNLEVKRGEVMGIIGRNGAGKSTLLKVLSRITEPTEGRVRIWGRVASLLEVGTGFHGELTGRENIYLNGAILGMSRAQIKSKFDEIVEFSGVERFLDTPVKRYSSGMYVRLAFGVAAHLEPDILLIDEVLAVGDIEFQKKCLGKMDAVANSGRTVLFVSHNMQTVASLCRHGVVLDKGRVLADTGMNAAIAAYTASCNAKPGSASNVIYESTGRPERKKAAITRVELLDAAKRPIAVVQSHGAIVFRVAFKTREPVPDGSVAVSIKCVTGEVIAKFETNPRRDRPLADVGEGFVDCCIDHLPLMPGQYLIGVGLNEHEITTIDHKHDIGTLVVSQSDDPRLDAGADPEGFVTASHRWELRFETGGAGAGLSVAGSDAGVAATVRAADCCAGPTSK